MVCANPGPWDIEKKPWTQTLLNQLPIVTQLEKKCLAQNMISDCTHTTNRQQMCRLLTSWHPLIVEHVDEEHVREMASKEMQILCFNW